MAHYPGHGSAAEPRPGRTEDQLSTCRWPSTMLWAEPTSRDITSSISCHVAVALVLFSLLLRTLRLPSLKGRFEGKARPLHCR